MRELGVLNALLSLLTVPFERLGTVAFHKLGFDKPLLHQSKLAAELLLLCIHNHELNCRIVLPQVHRLEPAARKGIGIGRVLQEVFDEVPVDTAMFDFWLDQLARARRGAFDSPDYSGGSMVLSLLHAFCFHRAQPVISNQNLISLKLIISPASAFLDRLHVLGGGQIVSLDDTTAATAMAPEAAVAPPSSSRLSKRRSSHDAPSAAEAPSGERRPSLKLPLSPGGARASAFEGVAKAEPQAAEAAAPVALSRSTSILSTFREEDLTPLRSMTRREREIIEVSRRRASAHEPLQDSAEQSRRLKENVLQQPALLCTVARRARVEQPGVAAMARVLCLSPCHPGGAWTPLAKLSEHAEMLDFFLHELQLIGGLCSAHNGLTLHTLRSLYPFELCMEILTDTELSTKLRAAVCVLTRQLYIESPFRLVRGAQHAIWDWDVLQASIDGDVPFHEACISLPPRLVAPDSDGASFTRKPSRKPSRGAAVGGEAADSDDGCAVSTEQVLRLEAFVKDFLSHEAMVKMKSREGLELLNAVLDTCLHLLRYGHLFEQADVEQIFQRIVDVLGVPQLKPRPSDDERTQTAFRLALTAKELVCQLLTTILDYRLRIRVGAVLRKLASPGSAQAMASTATSRQASRQTSRQASPSPLERIRTLGTRMMLVTSLVSGAKGNEWARLGEGAEADASDAAAAYPLVGLSKPADDEAGSEGGGAGAQNSGADLFPALQAGCEVLPWQHICEDMIRALFQTSSEARGTKPDLVSAALGVVFTQFNQVDRLAAAVSAVAVVKKGEESNGDANGSANASPLLQRQSSLGEASLRAPLSERTQATKMMQSLRILERVVMCLKALASTDATPDSGILLAGMTDAVGKLRALCTTRHQRRLQCALGSHEAVVNAICVLQQVVEADLVTRRALRAEKGAIPADEKQRLPPDALSAAREEAFDFLSDFCGSAGARKLHTKDSEPYEYSWSAAEDKKGALSNGHGPVGRDDADAGDDDDDDNDWSTDSDEGLSSSGADAGDAREPANQEAVFPHFALIVDHMSHVRKATTCAQSVLEANASNCGAITDSHFDQMFTLLMRARYSWFMDLLLTIARGLPDAEGTLPVKIVKRLLSAPNGHLLVLYSGAAGREKRARELVTMSEAEKRLNTGMLAFHHGLVQLLAELCSGLANEVEMCVQSIIPLHEICAHICDAFCPYAIKASFFVLLMEGYTATALKVKLVNSPAIWQVLALFASELQSLLEVAAGHGDADDRAQALLAVSTSSRGPSYVEAGLWFCVAFIQKHAGRDILKEDHETCLSTLRRIAQRLLVQEHDSDASVPGVPSLRVSTGGSLRFATKKVLSLGPHHLVLLSALVRAVEDKGIKVEMLSGKKSSRIDRWSDVRSQMDTEGAAPVHRNGSAPSPPLSPGGDNPGERQQKRGSTYSRLRKNLLKSPCHDSEDDRAKRKLEFEPESGALEDDASGKAPGPPASDSSAVNLAAAPAPTTDRTMGGGTHASELVYIRRVDGGLLAAQKLAAGVIALHDKLEAWEAHEFNRSVSIFKGSTDTIRPIVDMLEEMSADPERSLAASAASDIQSRSLRMLCELVHADVSLQDQLDSMGVTAVVVSTLAAPSTAKTFMAALELGVAMLDGGNRKVQASFLGSIATSGSNDLLAGISHALQGQCQRQLDVFMEEKQQAWYASLLEPHLKIARTSRRLHANEDCNRLRGSQMCRGSLAALCQAVVRTQARMNVLERPLAVGPAVPDASGMVDQEMVIQALFLLECACERQFSDMQNFLRVQPNMRTQVTVLIDLVNSLLVLERTLSSQTCALTCQVFQTIIELLQGPCYENQRFLIGTNLCDVAVRFMHGSFPRCDEVDVIELKQLSVKVILAMVEGAQSDMIARRIRLSLEDSRLVAELENAHRLSGKSMDRGDELTEVEQGYRELAFQVYLLILSLSKHDPALFELCKARAPSQPFYEKGTGSIELLMEDNTLQEVFFVTPPLCLWLTEKMMGKLLWEVDRSTPQKRVEDFVKRMAGLTNEMRHHERIAEIPIFKLLVSQSSAISQLMFVLSGVINLLVLLFTFPEDEIDDFGDAGAEDLEPRGYWGVFFQPVFVGDLVNFLGVFLVVVASTLLLEHIISTLPLTLMDLWEERGVYIDFPSIWPLKVELRYMEGHDPADAGASHLQAGTAGSDGVGVATGKDAHGAHQKGQPSPPKRADDGSRGRCVECALALCPGGGEALGDDGSAATKRRKQQERQLWTRVILWSPLLVLQQDMYLQYYSFYIGTCVLALTYTPFFFAVTLLDIVVRFRLLQKVIESVTINVESLGLTFVFIGVVIYLFSLFGAHFYREDYQFSLSHAHGNETYVDLCSSTRNCLMTTAYLGLSYDGLGQSLNDVREQWTAQPDRATIRWVVDLLFYILVIVLLLNIVFGIVIDTFAQQRDLQNQIKENMENVCFICSIDRNTFDRKHEKGYEYHIEHEHNVWHYLSFLIYLQQKKRTELNGPESYVVSSLERGDLSFFPILRTSSITYED